MRPKLRHFKAWAAKEQEESDADGFECCDPDEAACQFTEDYNNRCAEYPPELQVNVRCVDDNSLETFNVILEARPSYYATRI